MDFTFVIIIDDITKLEKKMSYLKSLKTSQYIFIGPGKYKDQLEYLYNCKYIEDSLSNVADAYNKSFEFIEGRYVNFSYASGFINKKDLMYLSNTIYNYNIIALDSILNTRKTPLTESKLYKVDDLDIKLIFNIGSYFFKYKTFKNNRFDPDFEEHSVIEYIVNTIIDNGSFYYLKGAFYHEYEDISDYNNSLSLKKDYYNEKFFSFLNVLQETDLVFVDYTCIYLILLRLASNYNDKGVLNNSEIEEFIDNTRNILNNIDDKLIRSYRSKVNDSFNKVLFSIKYDYKDLKLNDHGMILVDKDIISSPTDSKIVITRINNERSYLEFDIAYDSKELIDLGGSIIAKLDNRAIPIDSIPSNRVLYFFKKPFREEVMYNFKVNKNEIKDNSKIKFYFKYNDFEEELYFRYSGRGNKKIIYDKDKFFEPKHDSISFSRVSNLYLILKKIKDIF